MLRYVTCGLGIAIAAVPHSAFAQAGDWSGPYIGVTAGVTDQTTENIDNWCWAACDAPTIQSIKPAVGGTIGINQKVDTNLVVGLEADFQGGGEKVVVTPTSSTRTPPPRFTWTADYKWSASARARVGVLTGDSMVYVTGGYALSRAHFNENTTDYPPFASNPGPFGANWNGTLKGYVVGAGIEHGIGKATVKAEVLHSKYNIPVACYADTVGPTTGQCITSFSSEPPTLAFVPSATTIRVGFNYRF